MPTRVSDSTLEQFRHSVAGQQPTPAGVAVAAVTAGFALGLLAKVLTVTGRRHAPPGDSATLASLAAEAQAASERMLQLAGDDIAAFEAYLAARRMPHATDSEREARQQTLNSTVRRAIDVPLVAAQEASAGLHRCTEVSAAIPPALVADLGVTAALLASALRAFLLCAQSNVRQLAPDAAAYGERLATETRRHDQALDRAEALLESIRA